MAPPSRRGCSSPATLFSAVVLLALTTWATLLYRVFAAPPHNSHPPPTPCLSEERLLWSPRVVFTEHTMPASIHVSADGKIAAVHQHSSKIEAVALAKRLGVQIPEELCPSVKVIP